MHYLPCNHSYKLLFTLILAVLTLLIPVALNSYIKPGRTARAQPLYTPTPRQATVSASGTVQSQAALAEAVLFKANDADIALNAGGETDSWITVSELPADAIIIEVQFSLRVVHAQPSEVWIDLTYFEDAGNEMTEVGMWRHDGGADDAGTDDDPETDADIELTLRWIPTTFHGMRGNGDWDLIVYDDVVNGHTGYIDYFYLWIYYVVPPANDDFDQAYTIGNLPYVNVQDTMDATAAADDPSASCDDVGGNVWYRYTATEDGMVRFETAGSDYSTWLAIFTGTRGNLTEVGCNEAHPDIDMKSRVDLPVTAGVTYHLWIGGDDRDAGLLVLSAARYSPSQPPPAAPSQLQATALNPTQIRLTWVDNSHDETGFYIFEGSTWFTVGPNTTSFVHDGVEPDSYHCYQMYAFHDYGSSPWTDFSCVTTPAQVVAVQFSGATHGITEAAGAATMVVTLSSATPTLVSVNYATSNGTATAGSDYTAASGVLTFNPGETSKSFTVPVLADVLDEPNETVNLTLSGPNGATLGAPASATLTIQDDDPPPEVQFSTVGYSIAERDGQANIAVVLDAPSAKNVQVTYATSNGTATAGSDYTAANGVLTFNPGETSKSFTIPILDDSIDEPNETVNLALSNPGQATLGALAAATLTILDDDLPAEVHAAFSGAPTSGVNPLVVSFTDQSTGAITQWEWDFGDGGASNVRHPTYTYNDAGSFAVTLTVSGPGGSDSETKTGYVLVQSPLPDRPIFNPIANADGNGEYAVAWENTAGATGYELQEQHNGGAWNTIHSGTARTVNLSGKADGAWCYRVRASNAAGASGWSAIECTTVATSPQPQLAIPQSVRGAQGGVVALPVTYTGQGQDVSSLLFSVDYDETRLSFDPTDADGDCAPDAIIFDAALPPGFVRCADVNAADIGGEIDIRIADFSGSPRLLSSGSLLTLTFSVRAAAAVDSLAPVRFGLASFGGIGGESEGQTTDGSVLVLGAPTVVEMTAESRILLANGSSATRITARLLDAAGRGVPGYSVAFATTLGTISAVGRTDAQGRIVATLTAPKTLGRATVTASAGGASGNVLVEFVSGPPADVAVTANPAGIFADGKSTSNIRATVNDADGHPVANQMVTFTTTLGAITSSATTNAQGQATATLNAGTVAGNANVQASAGAAAGAITVSFLPSPAADASNIYLPLVSR